MGQFWAMWKWAPGIHVRPKQDFDIGWAEAIAVELGFCIVIHNNLLQVNNSNHFLVCSDNSGVVTKTKATLAVAKPTKV